MRALTNLSTLTRVASYMKYPRCYYRAPTARYDASIYYNTRATPGPCGGSNARDHCACQCLHSPPAPPLPPAPPPYAPLAWRTFSSGADCEANGCITPSSQAECEDAMRALTTRSELSCVPGSGCDYPSYPRCFTWADSSTPASDSAIYYNDPRDVPTVGDCGGLQESAYWSPANCACQCPPSPPASPPSPPLPPPPP